MHASGSFSSKILCETLDLIRILRKGCSEDCLIKPCLDWISSPDSQANATLFLAKFYGRAGLLNLLSAGPPHLRSSVFRSLLYDACGRVMDPVNGATGLLVSGQWHLCQLAVDCVMRGIPIVRNHQHQQQPMFPSVPPPLMPTSAPTSNILNNTSSPLAALPLVNDGLGPTISSSPASTAAASFMFYDIRHVSYAGKDPPPRTRSRHHNGAGTSRDQAGVSSTGGDGSEEDLMSTNYTSGAVGIKTCGCGGCGGESSGQMEYMTWCGIGCDQDTELQQPASDDQMEESTGEKPNGEKDVMGLDLTLAFKL